MLFKPGTPLYSYEVQREAGGQVIYVNYLGASFVPNLAENPGVMNRTIDLLIESPNVSRIVFVQQRNYNYSSNQIFMLQEIANLYVYLTKQEKILSPLKLSVAGSEYLSQRYNDVAYLLVTLKRDPIACYFELQRFLEEERMNLETTSEEMKFDQVSYIRLLEKFYSLLSNTQLIKNADEYFGEYSFGGRGLYYHFFRPDIIPNFTFTRLAASLPEDAEIVHQYNIGSGEDESVVTILKKKEETKHFYHLMPPEYSLDEDKQSLLNLARNVLIEHQPKAEEFTDPEKTRQVFFNVSRDLLNELSESRSVKLNYNELNKLANILVRHTIGFGLIEVLLQDKNLQDIVLNAPISSNPVYLRHGEYDECSTNIIPSREDADSWAAKFRMISGRPLDEANPILDTDLLLGRIRARVSVIQQPLSPNGLAYAIRRHREEPWTLSLFINNKMMNSFTAGLLSFLIDGSRTLLIAGTRSSGKCVDGNTLIQLSNGDIQPIKYLEHGKQEKISDGYIFYPNPELTVLSLDNEFKIGKKAVNAFWRREAPKTLIKITTQSGKEIITTQEHPYFVFQGDLKSICAVDLREGMLIASPRKINTNSDEIIFLEEAKEMISKIKTNAQKITFPERVNIELAEFIGYLIGDGHIDKYKIEFTNSNAELRARFTELSRKLFSVKTREIKSRNTFNIQITSRILNRIINTLFEIPLGRKADKIKIPSKILKSSNEILAVFLKAYFDCDGYIPKSKRDMEIATASEIMSKQLQISLLRFGIISFIKKKKVKGRYYYRVLIRGEFVGEYIKKIGFNHPNKKKRGEDVLKISFIQNTNIDTIPNGNYFLKELRKKLRVNPSEVRKTTGKDYWAYENNSYNITRKWFNILVKFYEERFDYLASLREEVEKLDENSDLDFFKKFRKILNIENEELAKGVSIGTISNFFNERHTAKKDTKKYISEQIKKIYKTIISEDVKNILGEAAVLASSDIFWDKIKSIEKVDSKDKWVYDFTVEPTQNFVANGLIAHNTSLLGALMLEIMPKYRVIVIEDSVTGDSKIIIKENGKFKKTTIGQLIDKQIKKNGFLDSDEREKSLNPTKIEIFSVGKKGKVRLAEPSKFIRHKTNKPIYEIKTTSGKKIKVTEDHSLFTLDEKNIFKPVKCKDLNEGSFIAIPKNLPFNNSMKKINLLNYLNKLDKKIFILGDGIEKYILGNRKELFAVAYSLGYKKSAIQNWTKKKILPAKIFEKIKTKIDKNDLKIKSFGSSKEISCQLDLDEDFLDFIGLWLADGCYDKTSVIISVQEKENRNIVRKIAKRFGIPVKMHTDTFSLMLNFVLLKEIMQKIIGLQGNSYTKKIPDLIHNFSNEQVGWLLKGFFSGDGCASDKEVVFSSCSKDLVEDISTLLLRFNIILRISDMRTDDKTYNCRIGNTKMLNSFKQNISFLVNFKREKLDKLCSRILTHDSSDVIPLPLEIKIELNDILGRRFSKHDYIARQNNIGREHLNKLLKLVPEGITNPIGPIRELIKSDIFWDKIKSIKKIGEKGFVYDISVPECENFICENIIAHNTLELPVDSLRKLKYDILRMKVRSSLLKTTTEIGADEGIRTSLRLGDSCLIVGEVRSSLRGDQEVVIVRDGKTERIPIKELEGVNTNGIKVPTLTNENKMELKNLTGFVKHPKRKKLMKITTKSGREVVVTPDHSVFTHVNFKIAAINADQLKQGDSLIIPSKIPCGFNDINYLNLLEIFKDDYRLENAEPYIRKAIKLLGWKKASGVCGISDIYRYLLSTQKTRIPINSFLKLMEKTKINYDISKLRVKKGTSHSIPAQFPVNENTLRLIGYYLAEGNIDKDKIQITNSKPKIIEDIKDICQKELGLKVSQREIKGYGSSVQMYLNSRPLLDLLVKIGCGKTSFEKRVPSFIYGLSEKKICALLKGMYSGDGSFTSSKNSGNMVRYFSTSKKLVEDVSYALLCLGVVSRLHKRPPGKKGEKICYIAEIKLRKYVKYFLENVGFTHKKPEILVNSFSHSEDNSVCFDVKELEKHIKLPRKYRHLRKTKCCSKDYLKKITNEIKCSEELYDFANGDFFIDRIKSVEIIKLDKPEYVYDLSVSSTQRFIGGFGGLLLHNTEAKALYEAMRVGALANVVAGTIHGASPYGVFDRVVNDLQVPITSFKATDAILVANPVKTPDGLSSMKRVVQLAEVRKHWLKDPEEEGGFVDLLKYNVENDELEASDELINGDSEIIKAIASGVRGWVGNWDAVYDNILLRSRIKQEIVDISKKAKKPEILESRFNALSNNMFHQFSEEVREDVGLPESERVFALWQDWLKNQVKGKKI